MIYSVLMLVHIIISAILVLVILVQTSKGGGLSGALGGTATNVLGGQGAPAFLKKATIVLALLFMLSCFGLAFYLKGGGKSIGKATAVDKLKKEIVNEQTTETELPIGTEAPATIPTETPTNSDENQGTE